MGDLSQCQTWCYCYLSPKKSSSDWSSSWKFFQKFSLNPKLLLLSDFSKYRWPLSRPAKRIFIARDAFLSLRVHPNIKQTCILNTFLDIVSCYYALCWTLYWRCCSWAQACCSLFSCNSSLDWWRRDLLFILRIVSVFLLSPGFGFCEKDECSSRWSWRPTIYCITKFFLMLPLMRTSKEPALSLIITLLLR